MIMDQQKVVTPRVVYYNYRKTRNEKCLHLSYLTLIQLYSYLSQERAERQARAYMTHAASTKLIAQIM